MQLSMIHLHIILHDAITTTPGADNYEDLFSGTSKGGNRR